MKNETGALFDASQSFSALWIWSQAQERSEGRENQYLSDTEVSFQNILKVDHCHKRSQLAGGE